MEKESEQKPEDSIAKPRLERLVLRNIPFVGRYSTRVSEKKHQSTIPSDLRAIIKLRQGVERIKDVALFCQLEENCLYLLDSPDEESCPDARLVRVEAQGRIILPPAMFTKPYARYTGRGSYIEVVPADKPELGCQTTE